jgi:pimeloyl-ACP methyl ester carboxylesterase
MMPTTGGGTQDAIRTVDRFVPHVSTVPAIKGQLVGLHLREKALDSVLRNGMSSNPHVVLFIHGGYSPSVVAYDLDYRDYSFMAALARAGFDVFAMAHTGYGASPKPLMDDPCNVDASVQPWIIPQVLKEACAPRYPFKLVSSRTEWDEIETVVRFIRELRNVERVSLIGWSTGAPRAGGFAALHPDAVDKLVLFGPAPYFPSDDPPPTIPEPGAPMILQSWDMLMNRRWLADVRCEGQIEDPDIREIMWRELMAVDGLGATWGRDGRGVMRAPSRMNFGWRANVAKIRAPTLIVVGEFDNYEKRRDMWTGWRGEHKAFIKVACASHFIQYERGRHLLHRAAREWLAEGTIEGRTSAELCADRDGRLAEMV